MRAFYEKTLLIRRKKDHFLQAIKKQPLATDHTQTKKQRSQRWTLLFFGYSFATPGFKFTKKQSETIPKPLEIDFATRVQKKNSSVVQVKWDITLTTKNAPLIYYFGRLHVPLYERLWTSTNGLNVGHLNFHRNRTIQSKVMSENQRLKSLFWLSSFFCVFLALFWLGTCYLQYKKGFRMLKTSEIQILN